MPFLTAVAYDDDTTLMSIGSSPKMLLSHAELQAARDQIHLALSQHKNATFQKDERAKAPAPKSV